MANLEVALDSRRMNPDIRVVMGLFDQSIASKISNAFLVDVAFSASTLAAPMVAAMSLGSKALSSSLIAGIPHVSAELQVEAGSELAGKRVEEVERGYCCKILARTPASGPIQLPAESRTVVEAGDLLVVHTPASQMATLAAAGKVGIGAASVLALKAMSTRNALAILEAIDWSNKPMTTRISGLSRRESSATSRFPMSSLVAMTIARAWRMPACTSTASSFMSPTRMGTLSCRACGRKRPFSSFSIPTTAVPALCSSSNTRIPSRPSPHTTT
jgi:hypothetical protein